VKFVSRVTNAPDMALTSCKSTILPASVGTPTGATVGGGLDKPRRRFRHWIRRDKGPLGDVGFAMGD
jgi:hypothetical protein